MAGLCYEAAEVAARVYETGGGWGDTFLVEPPFIAIRGSDDPVDWWSNIHISRTGKLHSGFLEAAHNISLQLPAIFGGTIFTGHSRGGAIAEILAQRFKCHAITFGAPKTGVKYDKVTAFIAAGDPVPHLPLTYRRRTPYFYLKRGEVIQNISWATVLWDILTLRGVQHSMSNYLELLNP